MKLKLILSSLILLVLFYNGYSQNSLNNLEATDGKGLVPNSFRTIPAASKIALGGGLGPAFIVEGSSGLTFNFFAEIKTESFSLLPQVNYWKAGDQNNFEVAGLLRLKFKTPTVIPYVDGGIGVNFLTQKILGVSENLTKVGLDLGGGVEFPGIGPTFSLYVDGKYKIIISDPNISGYFLTGGIKFDM